MSHSTAPWSVFKKEIIKHRKIWTIKDEFGIPLMSGIKMHFEVSLDIEELDSHEFRLE